MCVCVSLAGLELVLYGTEIGEFAIGLVLGYCPLG